MPSTTQYSPVLSVPYITEGQFGAEITHNDGVNVQESFAQLSVKSRTTAAQPGSPANGDAYLLTAAATGTDWAANPSKIAFYYSGWKFYTVKEGWRLWVQDENKLLIHNGSIWEQIVSQIGAGFADERRFYQSHTVVGGTTFLTVGAANVATVGTPTNADSTDGPYIQVATAATIGDQAGYRTAVLYRRNWLADVVFTFKTGADITSVRTWVGLMSSAPFDADDFGGTTHVVALRYSTVADGTAFWRCVTRDGTTQTVFTSTAAIAASTRYVLRIRLFAASVEFWLNGVLIHTATATLPGAATSLLGTIEVIAQAASARNIHVSRITGTQL